VELSRHARLDKTLCVRHIFVHKKDRVRQLECKPANWNVSRRQILSNQ
jgi:hypothetical protein